MIKSMKSPRRLAAVAVFAIVAVSAFGFAAGNTTEGTSYAGFSDDTISGFDITNVTYENTGEDLTNVSFDISPAAGSVEVKVTAAGLIYTPCTLSLAGTHASCGLAGVTVLAADELSIVALQ